MRISEIITETSSQSLKNKIPDDQVDAINGARTNHDTSINKSDGSAYKQYRHGLALACSGAGKTADEKMPGEGAFSGDPVYASYVDEEDEMISRAEKTVGATRSKRLSDKKSKEADDVHRHSPVPHNSGIIKRDDDEVSEEE